MGIQDVCKLIESYGVTVVNAVDPVDGLSIPTVHADDVVKIIARARFEVLEANA